MEIVTSGRPSTRIGSWSVLLVETSQSNQLVDITQLLNALVAQSGVRQGNCHLFIPHPNAVILSTLNEFDSLDSLEQVQLMMVLEEAINRGNSVDLREQAAVSETVAVEGGTIALRHGFGVYVCEYDGPRELEVMVKIEGD